MRQKMINTMCVSTLQHLISVKKKYNMLLYECCSLIAPASFSEDCQSVSVCWEEKNYLKF